MSSSSVQAVSHLDSATRSELAIREGRSTREALAVTIIAHPRLGRIGERAFLRDLQAGGEVRLSRSETEFAQPRRGSRRSLEHGSRGRPLQ